MLPSIKYLTGGSDYSDYRPAIGSDSDGVIFERTYLGSELTKLYRLSIANAENPTPFLTNNEAPVEQTRPDWCWQSGRVAFNGSPRLGKTLYVHTVDEDGGNLSQIQNSAGYAYPTWDRNSNTLVCESGSTAASPSPCNTWFDPNGIIIQPNISGSWLNLVPVSQLPFFGGMPAVGPKGLPQIAFAGQPVVENWNKQSGQKYNQNFNYIILNNVGQPGALSSEPMEREAFMFEYQPQCQGRAPAWSPDGQTIAFESDRSGQGYAIYLCDLPSRTISQVTDPALGAQHAKFFPCGTKLILCLKNSSSGSDNMCIAWVDISDFLRT